MAEAVQRVLLTGAAGFIGAAVALELLERGIEVVGVDNLNDYYSPALKQARLGRLEARKGFAFHKIDIADFEALKAVSGGRAFDCIVHLAAQAGVRHSLRDPFAYARSNLVGHLAMLELARAASPSPHFVYASSSSVYGANAAMPFSERDRVDAPVSLYAATKRADELMSESYARLYGLPQVGLRFFTVYGPWGRPDMASWLFADAIMSGRPITLFNDGDLERDFSYVDDVVSAVLAVIFNPLKPQDGVPHRLYNVGASRPEKLKHFVEVLEAAIGMRAVVRYAPMQPGDVRTTSADVSAIAADYGWRPATSLEEGLPKFIDWFRAWRKAC